MKNAILKWMSAWWSGKAGLPEEHGHWFSLIKNHAGECFGRARNWLIFVIYGDTMKEFASDFS